MNQFLESRFHKAAVRKMKLLEWNFTLNNWIRSEYSGSDITYVVLTMKVLLVELKNVLRLNACHGNSDREGIGLQVLVVGKEDVRWNISSSPQVCKDAFKIIWEWKIQTGKVLILVWMISLNNGLNILYMFVCLHS